MKKRTKKITLSLPALKKKRDNTSPGCNRLLHCRKGTEKVFFSEEKNQKTFVPALISVGVLLAGTHGYIGFGQKFFGSFFQKRTFFAFLFDRSMPTRVGIKRLILQILKRR